MKTYFPGSANSPINGAGSKPESEATVLTAQQQSSVKVFSNADLWNIQRRRKSVVLRRNAF